MKTLIKVLDEISKLPSIDKKLILDLNTFQLEVLSKISKKKIISTRDLLKSEAKYSQAQKYRYLKELVERKLCEKKHNLFKSVE
jgi:hypothetical protein